MILSIVGARFRPPAQDILNMLPAGSRLILRRQPDNPYDANAVQVLLPGYNEGGDHESLWEMYHENYGTPENGELHLGFVPRGNAAELSPKMVHQHEEAPEGESRDLEGVLTFSGTSGSPQVSFEEP